MFSCPSNSSAMTFQNPFLRITSKKSSILVKRKIYIRPSFCYPKYYFLNSSNTKSSHLWFKIFLLACHTCFQDFFFHSSKVCVWHTLTIILSLHQLIKLLFLELILLLKLKLCFAGLVRKISGSSCHAESCWWRHLVSPVSSSNVNPDFTIPLRCL